MGEWNETVPANKKDWNVNPAKTMKDIEHCQAWLSGLLVNEGDIANMIWWTLEEYKKTMEEGV